MNKAKAVLACGLAAVLLAGCGGGVSNSRPAAGDDSVEPAVQSTAPAAAGDGDSQSQDDVFPAPDFELVDQYGKTHRLSDYAGKMVFLNFWATWCGPCRDEMPDIEQLYQDYGAGEGELVVLGVAMPLTDENKRTSEGTPEEVAAFLAENGYTYPTLMDTTGAVFATYAVNAYPTTYMVTKDGNLAGYVAGSISRSIMDSIIDETEAKSG